MFTPLLELEGTRDEIIAQLPEVNGHRLRVSVAVEEKPKQPDPLQTLVEQIAARTIAMNLPPDPRNYLREGRSGEMYGIVEGESDETSCD